MTFSFEDSEIGGKLTWEPPLSIQIMLAAEKQMTAEAGKAAAIERVHDLMERSMQELLKPLAYSFAMLMGSQEKRGDAIRIMTKHMMEMFKELQQNMPPAEQE
ncbi:hypothetical protein KW782_03490 [Candidatus Parcubacteria bacterium]|nr:hypothetical protein [Candidatus Parcubacteria bacterium]